MTCKVCTEMKSTLGAELKEFLEWFAFHQGTCNSNFNGTSPGMEAEGISQISARSVALYKIWYTTVIADGDTKSVVQCYLCSVPQPP